MKSVGTILVLIFSTLLALIVAALICMILFELLPDPIYGAVIAGAVFFVGFGIAIKWAIRYGRSSDRYTHCPGCAFDVRAVQPDAGGTIRCPSCAQWLSGPAGRAIAQTPAGLEPAGQTPAEPAVPTPVQIPPSPPSGPVG